MATRPINIGIQLPIVETDDRDAPRWPEILELAIRAEELGLDSVWVPDHLLFRRPGATRPTHGIWESWSLVAALAAATTRISIGTLVTCTAFRHPVELARMASTVHQISGGRLILGLGAGWHEPEFRAFGLPFDHRASRFEEALATIRDLLNPKDRERPKIPLMVGTTGERMLRITARYADLWNTGLVTGQCGPDAVPPLRAKVDAACFAVGRDPATLGRTINPMVTLPLPGATPIPPGDLPLTGNTDPLAEAFRGFARQGICHLQLLLNPCTVSALEIVAGALAQLDPAL